MREKKFMYYKVVVEHDNGSIEVLNEDTQYKSILEKYREIKHLYKNPCRISCVGIDKYNCESVLWERNTLIEKDITLENFEKNINKIVELIDAIDIDTKGIGAVLDKKQDIILHKIESVEQSKLNSIALEKEKLRLMDELIEIRNTRRDMKCITEINSYTSCIVGNINPIKAKLEELKKQRNKFNYNKINVAKTHDMQELTYRNDKQKDDIYNLFKTMYSSVVIDGVNKKVVGYNKCFNKHNKK